MRASIEQLVAAVVGGDRRALAQAITLVESARPSDAQDAERLLAALAPHAGKALRVGVTGVPGVGKSTFLDALGMEVIARGKRVAVLAVDPSSARSGGSILGDKTRMERLAREAHAFVRPTAGGAQLGGIASRTREAMLVCEAAGYDVVFVETIGTGQAETAVRDLVDVLVLLMLAGAGDELQGIKRGVLELADVVLVNKADGENTGAADHAAAELHAALRILRGADVPAVATCSARTGAGIGAAWDAIVQRRDALASAGTLDACRREQDVLWFERRVDELLRARFLGADSADLDAAREAVRRGRDLPFTAARRVIGAE